ncbi:hypothetical protein SPF06_05060 [Sinomonas sp. JGH33]|uniref:TetR family transcriptional regulator n=1 Tax=Sinomonas terricola TaxID=3110330 RepID=A0ABU5T378_9MICC|nr:hypothetical protein [Sinomonas sp. JGH33]MEA5454088.1 hypothetical protein [Sinomonas sp. JGH33]
MTRAFLGAALTLVEERYMGSSFDATDEEAVPLAYLSRPRVLRRTQERWPELVPTEAKFRDRWVGQQDFLADFISYALAVRHRRFEKTIAEWAGELTTPGHDFARAVHAIAYRGMRLMVDLPAFRLQLLAAASADDDVAADILHEAIDSMCRTLVELHELVVGRFGLRLRPGISSEHVAMLLQALAEGLGIRLLAGQESRILDPEREASLLGTAALGLFMSLCDPGDGMSVEDAARQFVRASVSSVTS